MLLLLLLAMATTTKTTSTAGAQQQQQQQQQPHSRCSPLADVPIAADTVTYLDGQWVAIAVDDASGTATGQCTYAKNTDWRPKGGGGSGHPMHAADEGACCQACIAAASCVVASLAGTDCWLKTASDAAGGSFRHPNVTSCSVTRFGPGDAGNIKHTIPGSVPGDIITDLQNHGLVGDPYFEINFRNVTLWHNLSWTYSTTFTVDASQQAAVADSGGQHVLVFDGIKMGAVISLNGKVLGLATDQFLRYQFPLPALNTGTNVLNVSFGNRSIETNGRWMPCSQGWDWAPISRTGTFSYGIWKSVYLVEVRSAAITHVVPQITFKGDYPVAPLRDGAHAGFRVDVRTHFWAPKSGAHGTLTLMGSWGQSTATSFSPSAGDSSVTLTINASAADTMLWWPVGHGGQHLYNVTVSFVPHALPAVTPLRVSQRVGFRVFALVTGNDTDPEWVVANKNGDGSATHGMYWRVNGAAIFAKGSSMVPMEELEGRMTAEAHYELVKSAATGGFNTLRVWGAICCANNR
jgi:hypothetical protein